MKYVILSLGLISAFICEAGTRMTPLAYSKNQIQAVLNQLDNQLVFVSSIKALNSNQVKVQMISTVDKSCSAYIYQTYMNLQGVQARNPRPSNCD